MSSDLPTLRWGTVATGLISSWFVQDLLLSRPNAEATHVIRAVGASSIDKARAFADKYLTGQSVSAYGSYAHVYQDPAVDIVYIGTPHAFHRQNCLDSIAHGKHVLCEKPFALNAREAREVFDAARAKGVFVMEAMWTRFFPLVRTLQRLVDIEWAIGDVRRVFCDFAMDMKLASLGPDSRLRNRALGAGTLLDVGIYSLTWGLLALEPEVGEQAERPSIVAPQSLSEGIDVATCMILQYADGRQGVLTSAAFTKTPAAFCRIEGTGGVIVVEGFTASVPASSTVRRPKAPGSAEMQHDKYEFERPGKGFYWAADAVAQSIAAGKTESDIMPWAETLRVLEMLDEVRRLGGASFPQDAS
ncbi:dimeric dihydrodiol dehydrogenase [Achaetomium macrosporum]|uniref:D-xylose 1-dehydrogenase (NADP(+), D-xylono-1,5-lactone-forming) n=1 Tax=Achaetomium macrosporum TaxID=79813 RepID=A0AAN7H8I3_9PEZI|nr:dimeric dihydrodiol dehydrogenase [Achaetomium macrosporum]